MPGETSSFSSAKRMYFSIQHIQSAALFARHVAKLEATFDGRFSDELISEHIAYVTASIFASTSFLEATVNEFFSDAGAEYMGIRTNMLNGLDENTINLMADMWSRSVPRTAHYNVIEKYDIAIVLARKQPFDRGRRPYQDIDLLIKLRNNLIHYEPEWRHSDVDLEFTPDEEQKFIKGLRGKFSLNPMIGEGNPFYPDRCLSHGCAKWAVESSIQFADEFFNKLGVTAFYEHIRARLSCSQ